MTLGFWWKSWHINFKLSKVHGRIGGEEWHMHRWPLNKRKCVCSGTFLTLPWLSLESQSLGILSCLPHFITSKLCSLVATSRGLVTDSAPLSHRYWRGNVIWLRLCWKELLPWIWNHYPQAKAVGAAERCTYCSTGSKGTGESASNKNEFTFKVHTELWSRLPCYAAHSQQYSHPEYY